MKKILFSMLALFAIATTARAQGSSINGHEYVDLELPSGTLWATCNVGATKPEEYGDYFAWGETTKKNNYSWDTYKWGMQDLLTKYCRRAKYGKDGFVDNLATLSSDDDAATANWGGKWRMPTGDEVRELLKNTTVEWTTVNDVKGYKCTAKNGNSIFLPASGICKNKFRENVGTYGCYWSSSLSTRYDIYAYAHTFNSNNIGGVGETNRFSGGSVRPVSSKDVVQNGIAINATNFPDANFRGYVSANTIDKDEDGYLSDEEIAKVTTMYVYGKSIANLTGIEHFTALTDLRCYENKLTSLDVSKNTALTYLDCTDNDLTELDLSKNTALKELWCFGNRIKGDKMQALVNSLLTVSNGTFGVINTKDSSEENVITKSQVTIAKNKGWKYVYDWNDGYYKDYAGSDDPGIAINDTNFPDANFRSYVSANTIDKDKDGYLSDTEIANVTSIDVPGKRIANLKGIEFFTELTSLNCGDNDLASLNLAKNTKLTKLECYFNQLTSLDVSNNTALRYLDCSGNKLTSLDVSNNTALVELFCTNCQLNSLDLSQNTALVELLCGFNQLESLDLSQNTALTTFYCLVNQIKSDKMQALVNSLPTVEGEEKGQFYVINTKDENEKNVITKSQVAIAKGKNWTVYDCDFYNGSWGEYAGSDDTPTGLTAVESGQLTVDSWYSIDGKKLQGEPTKKGVYIVNGKKIVK